MIHLNYAIVIMNKQTTVWTNIVDVVVTVNDLFICAILLKGFCFHSPMEGLAYFSCLVS